MLVLDIVIPDMDGIEVLRKVRDLSDKPIIIVTSALSNAVIMQEALVHGACAYFKKPIRLEVLVERIRSLFSTQS